MSVELINRITVKKDGVYISSHSNNDNSPFYSHRIKGLSDVYAAEGQHGLDREVIRMLFEYARLRGKHHSLDKYYYALRESRFIIQKDFERKINEEYLKLNEEDIQSWYNNPTDKVKQYMKFEQEARDEMYSEIANFCKEYDK